MNNKTLNRKPVFDKKRAVYRDDYDSDNDESGATFPDISGLMKPEKKKVFRDHNHIYFRCDVTMDKVNKLCNLIEEYNREQEMFRTELTSLIVVPKPIYLHITSMGGDMLGGFLAFDYIKNSKIPIYTIAEGYAVSSGANMFMAGNKRYMTENSYVLIHQLSANKHGRETFHDTIDDVTNSIEFMTKLYGIFLNNIRYNRTDVLAEDILTKEKLENHMLHDVYWNFDTCKRYGLVDELYTNYTDTDIQDIHQYLKNSTKSSNTSFKANKIYSLKDLKPSDEVMQRIRQTVESKKENDMIEMIKKHIATKLTTNDKVGLVNIPENQNIEELPCLRKRRRKI